MILFRIFSYNKKLISAYASEKHQCKQQNLMATLATTKGRSTAATDQHRIALPSSAAYGRWLTNHFPILLHLLLSCSRQSREAGESWDQWNLSSRHHICCQSEIKHYRRSQEVQIEWTTIGLVFAPIPTYVTIVKVAIDHDQNEWKGEQAGAALRVTLISRNGVKIVYTVEPFPVKLVFRFLIFPTTRSGLGFRTG